MKAIYRSLNRTTVKNHSTICSVCYVLGKVHAENVRVGLDFTSEAILSLELCSAQTNIIYCVNRKISLPGIFRTTRHLVKARATRTTPCWNNEGKFCNNIKIDTLISKRLFAENKAKLSQLEIVNQQYCGGGVSFQMREFCFVLYR